MKPTLTFLLMCTALPPTTPAVSHDSSLSFEWTSPLSMRVRNRAGEEDDIDLRPANTMGDVTVDCLFTGFYVKDIESSAGVVGCQDWDEVNIVTVSNISTGTMFTLFNRNKTTVELLYTSPFNDDYVEEEHQRPKRSDYNDESEKDYVDDDIEYDMATLPPNLYNTPSESLPKRSDYYDESEKDYVDDDIEYDMATLPPNLYYEFQLAFDDALLTVMNENKTAAEEYVTAVATLAQTFFKKASLGTNIHFVIKNKPRHLVGKEFQINPNAPGLKLKLQDTYTIDSSEPLIIFTATDETELWRGAAKRRRACSKTKARALLKHRKEIQKAALTMAHEMGHLYGKYHDGSSREDPKCVGKGIMTDTPTNRPEKWSICSRERLIKWFMRPDNKASTCLKTAPPCNNDAWSQNVPCSCGEDVRTNLCTSQEDGYCEISTATCKGEPLASDIVRLNAIIQNMKLEMDTLRQIITENNAETTNLKTCLADTSSPVCPPSTRGKTGITGNTAAITQLENCLADPSCSVCPRSGPGSTGLSDRITENTAATKKLEGKVAILERKSSYCAYRSSWSTVSREILYDSITLNDNNVPGANFNTGTGRFTAGVAGTYLIQVSMTMKSKSGNSNYIYIRKNNGDLGKGYISSGTSTSTAHYESGGRSIMLHLNTGDTVSLYTHRVYYLSHITFCIALS